MGNNWPNSWWPYWLSTINNKGDSAVMVLSPFVINKAFYAPLSL